MKSVTVLVLFGAIAMVAAQVHVVDQNPEVEARVDGFTDTIRDRVAILRSRVRDRTNTVISALLGVNVVDNNTPPPTPVQVVDNSVNGVNVVDNSLPVNVVDNNTPPPTPVQVVDNSVNGVNVVDNSPPGAFINVDPGFSQPGINQGIDPGFYRPPRPNVRPPRPHVRPPRPGGNLGDFSNVDSGFYQPRINQGDFSNVDSGFYQPGINQGPDPDVYYRPNPWLRGGQ